MASKAKQFEGKSDDEKKDNIIEFLESVSSKLGIKRDDLASELGISHSAFYGWIYRREIPYKSYERLLAMRDADYIETKDKKINAINPMPTRSTDLSSISLDDLVAEIEKRNWIVKIERKP